MQYSDKNEKQILSETMLQYLKDKRSGRLARADARPARQSHIIIIISLPILAQHVPEHRVSTHSARAQSTRVPS
jgi:hypothetical protein